MTDITKPDFEEWASNLLSGRAHVTDWENALRQAYEQGRTLGYRDGYDHGMNVGWAEIQDADQTWIKDMESSNAESDWLTNDLLDESDEFWDDNFEEDKED